MRERWNEEKAWEWYNARPWMRGCNYMSADCANRVDQWQALGFEERMKTTEEELALMQKTGFNTVRLILEFVVWRDEHDSFLERFDRYLDLCAKYGISCMVTLANDCMPPKNELWRETHVGEQHYDWGYHGGRKSSQHGAHAGIGPHFLDQPEMAELYYEMVREIVTIYKEDERISIWDVYNEPGNSNRRELTVPHITKLFEIVRKIDPVQPLTAGLFNLEIVNGNLKLNEVQTIALENSDLVSYHCYEKFAEHVRWIKQLKKFNRPILCTEWLGRTLHNDVFDVFPLFYLEKIGCYNWGFVAGKYQTYEPWEKTWKAYDKDHDVDYEFTKWFHDLYRPNHRPYDPKEIDLIQYLSEQADIDFENEVN